MATIEAKNKEQTIIQKHRTIQISIGYEQLLDAIQQLPDEQRIDLLNTLQAQLEKEQLIKPRTDEDQRRNYVPAPKPERPGYKKPKVTPELIKQWEEAEDEGEELDANLTTKELLEMIKNI